MKWKNSELETKNFRFFWFFPFWGIDEMEDKFKIYSPRFELLILKDEDRDGGTYYYKWTLHFGYITILRKAHPAYDDAARKYNWDAVL